MGEAFTKDVVLGRTHQAIVDGALSYIPEERKKELKDPANEEELVKFIITGGSTNETMARSLVNVVRDRL